MTILSLNPKPQQSRPPKSERSGSRGGSGRSSRGRRSGGRREERREDTPRERTAPRSTGSVTPVENDAEMFERYLASHPQSEPKPAAPKPQDKPKGHVVDDLPDDMPLYGKIEL